MDGKIADDEGIQNETDLNAERQERKINFTVNPYHRSIWTSKIAAAYELIVTFNFTDFSSF